MTVNWESLDIDNMDEYFYTDSNALEIVKREVNSYEKYYGKPTTQTAASNFYPVNSGIMIEDTYLKQQMTVMNDRSQSASAFKFGRIEMMINRRGFT